MHLIFDFDGTITQQDTIGVLADAAIDYQKRQGGQDLQAEWDQVVRSYMDDFQRYSSSHPTPASERTRADEELRFLSGMKDVEEASLRRVADSRVFAGLDAEMLRAAGAEAVRSGRVKIREGFSDLLGLAAARGWDTCVVSVNWSRAFIEGALLPRRLRVVANEPHADGSILGPEFLGGRMTNGREKRAALDHLAAGRSDGGERVLYFGDSTTDMECLLQGGIVISDDGASSLMRTLRRVGEPVPHVGERKAASMLMWARDFREVLESGVLNE
ncbi:HAD-like domain-containing protein [Dactylonectria estremocensis]|uniref:HAD-like domain-containing protein n=1 Tax=Dactylonectria estremocensis TaxID=1079267 RepID=A0A9P9FK43_9HYPO|nr:HAD-like domain-containing protein [Dactylonectria estremocensis]